MDPYLTLPRLEELLSAVRELRVGVIGDFRLNGRWIADMTRAALSAEMPLYPRPVVEERYSCGGAANVAWNLAALGLAEVRAFTVLGEDWRGSVLRRILQAEGVDPRDALEDPHWSTPFFGKVLLTSGESQQEDSRLDFINTDALSPQSEQELLDRLEAALPDLDAVVVADDQPVGVVTPRVIRRINALVERGDMPLFTVDSRERVGQFHNIVRKPNELEAARWLFPERALGLVGLEEFAEAALHPQIDCGCPQFITFGEKGCLVIASGESHLVPAVPVRPPVDAAGAGETFLAALTAGLAAGANPVEAACLGHLAAAVTVKKIGITGAATPEEIRLVAGQAPEKG